MENALLKRAIGFRYDEVAQEAVKQIDEETGGSITVMVKTKHVTKEVQRDGTAQIF